MKNKSIFRKNVKKFFKQALKIKKTLLFFLAVQLVCLALFLTPQWQEINTSDTHTIQGKVESYWILNMPGRSNRIYITVNNEEYVLYWHRWYNEEFKPSHHYNFDELIGEKVFLVVCNGTTKAVGLKSEDTVYYKLEYYNSQAAVQRMFKNIALPIIWFITTVFFAPFILLPFLGISFGKRKSSKNKQNKKFKSSQV